MGRLPVPPSGPAPGSASSGGRSSRRPTPHRVASPSRAGAADGQIGTDTVPDEFAGDAAHQEEELKLENEQLAQLLASNRVAASSARVMMDHHTELMKRDRASYVRRLNLTKQLMDSKTELTQLDVQCQELPSVEVDERRVMLSRVIQLREAQLRRLEDRRAMILRDRERLTSNVWKLVQDVGTTAVQQFAFPAFDRMANGGFHDLRQRAVDARSTSGFAAGVGGGGGVGGGSSNPGGRVVPAQLAMPFPPDDLATHRQSETTTVSMRFPKPIKMGVSSFAFPDVLDAMSTDAKPASAMTLQQRRHALEQQQLIAIQAQNQRALVGGTRGAGTLKPRSSQGDLLLQLDSNAEAAGVLLPEQHPAVARVRHGPGTSASLDMATLEAQNQQQQPPHPQQLSRQPSDVVRGGGFRRSKMTRIGSLALQGELDRRKAMCVVCL